jgi:hypothetical protein
MLAGGLVWYWLAAAVALPTLVAGRVFAVTPSTTMFAPLMASAPAYPLQLGASGRYLVDQANQPVLLAGDAAWSLIAQATDAEADKYLANRQQKGFNTVLVNLIEHKFATNAPHDINGDPPFSGAPFATPDEAYFAHADRVISSAAQKGINALLDPLYLGYDCNDEGWCAEVQRATTQDLQSWGEYVGARYRNFDNIMWVVGADVDPNSRPGLSAKVSAFAAALQQADGRHLFTAHNVRGEMAIAPWPGAAWLSVNDTYATYLETVSAAQSAYNVSPPMPFFQIEGWYENEHSMTTQQLRAQAYWTVLSGGMGYVFGNCPVWGFGRPALSFCQGTSSDWQAQLDGPGSTSTMVATQLLTQRAWQGLVPDWNHAIVTSGYGSVGSPDYVAAAGSPDGSLVLAYLPGSRTVTVDLSGLNGQVSAHWYDPGNGASTDVNGSPFGNTAPQDFTPPGRNSAGDND